MISDFNFYMDYRNSLDNLYNKKYIVIRDRKVIGVFDSEENAYKEAMQNYEPFTFWVQYCEAGIN